MTETPGLWNIAARDPGRPALFDAGAAERTARASTATGDQARASEVPVATYGELAARANRIARGLQARGLRPGDAVVLLAHNCADFVATYFATFQSGLYVVAVNWHLAGPEIAYILRDSQAKAFVASDRFAAAAQVAAGEPGLLCLSIGHIDGFTPLSELGDGESGDSVNARPDIRTAGGPMLYTSGTTGKPKGVRRPLTGADPDVVPPASHAFFGLFGIKQFDGHVHICGSPMYHTAVLNFVAISIQLGHPVVLMDRWEPELMLALIDKYRVTHSHMVPTQFVRLLALPDAVRAKYHLSSLRVMIHGAAPCPPEVKRRMLDWWGPVVTEYYAATEGGGTTISGAEWLRKPGSVGKAWPWSTVKVLDDAGAEVPAGEPGQVYLKMGGSSFEYHNDKAKTQAARVGELFTLGDIGYLDSDSYLFLCDRKSDMIISGGVNVYPAEIEGYLAGHPKVADVAVFGVPHPEWGEEIKAVVQPADGVVADDGLTAELLEFARTGLAKFKLPRSIDYIDELPRDPNGKMYKRRLRDPYWAGRAAAI